MWVDGPSSELCISNEPADQKPPAVDDKPTLHLTNGLAWQLKCDGSILYGSLTRPPSNDRGLCQFARKASLFAGHAIAAKDARSRRSFVRIGAAGMASVGLPQVLRAQQQSAALGANRKDTRVILVWIDGGPGHMDLYDMKPDAPPAYRGIWLPIKTNVPGMEITQLFPKQAKVADKFSIVRSLHHEIGRAHV